MSRDPIDHASEAGYHQHRRADTDPCLNCLAAHARYNQKSRRYLNSHGTLVGLERHTLLGTPVCDPCLNLACALEQDRTWGPINRRLAS